MKKLFFYILLFFYSLLITAQSHNYIKFEGANNEKLTKLLINKSYLVKLKSNYIYHINKTYDSSEGIRLYLIGCNKDSLYFKDELNIPLFAIESIDNIKRQTILYSSLLALNLSIIGVANYYTISKINHFDILLYLNLPFLIGGIGLIDSIPNPQKTFYVSNYSIKEYCYYNRKIKKICSYGFKNQN